MIRIAIFASGEGTNAENIVRYFNAGNEIRVHVILTDKEKSGVRKRAENLKLRCEYFSSEEFLHGNGIPQMLAEEKIDFIVLAGFLLLVPDNILKYFKSRIFNIHPALLPAHGGKGFYGHNVHQAVINSGSILSGITIHHVNEKFDEGEIIFQAACYVDKHETAESLAAKIHDLEHRYFPVVIEKMVRDFYTLRKK